MEKRSMKYTFASLILVMAIFFSPVAPAIRLHQVTMLWETMKQVVMRQMNVPTAQAEGPGNSTIYLPIAITAGEAPPPAAPAFEIISPANGGTISGMMYFAVQPTDAVTVSSVSFKAGSTDLGTDSDGSNGFRVFLNASDLPAGTLQLEAIGTGVGGETTKRISVNVVPNPPSSATVGSEGGVLASEIGSVITILPDSVPDGTNITVTEKTQEQVTADNGFDWDAMGVTFLGAQEIQSTEPFSKPVGMVASAGFGNRVQPGQAVVNYRIAPDADGDGVDELIVVNTASVAPNGDVISDPVPQVSLGSNATTFNSRGSANHNLNGGISGPPGTIIELEATGFNPTSAFGNLAIFRSSVDGTEFEVPGWVTPSQFSVIIPPLPAGSATLILRNLSTGFESEPIDVTVESPSALDAAPEEIINDFSDETLAFLSSLDLSDAPPQAEEYQILAITNLEQFTAAITDGTIAQQVLTDVAVVIKGSGMLTSSNLSVSDRYREIGSVLLGIGRVMLNSTELLQSSVHINSRVIALHVAITAALITGAAVIIAALIQRGGSSTPAININCTGNCNININTGMGAAPPPGGNGGGNVTGGGGGGLRNQRGGGFGLEPGRFVIKVLSGGSSIPFSGVTDAGGYFFIPLIPEAEPFTAIAFDTTTGETRTFEGTGPPTGESVFMFFDFLSEGQSAGTPIEIGDVVNGEISEAGELDIYSFEAQAGQVVFFDLQDQSGISQVDWQLVDRTGTVIFDTCLGCGEPGVRTLTQGGTYTLIVGEGGNNQTGSYQFQLWNVPPPNEFAINIGDVVSDGNPAAGAGNIESPGVKDIYTFNASAGQQVFFDQQGHSGISQINWQVVDQDGTVIFDTCLGCGDPGVRTLTRGGTYTLTVGDNRDDGFGTYQFQLWNVPSADEFAINIGDVVSDGNPAAGAGNIESPGVKDIYTFNATAGQQVFFDQQGQNGIRQVNWQVVDEDGTEIFNTCLACGDPGVRTLTRGGTYTLIVGEDRNDQTGTYQFQIRDKSQMNTQNSSVPISR